MNTLARRLAHPRAALFIALAGAGVLGMASSASVEAAITYSLDRPSAAPGDTVQIRAMYFNDGTASSAIEAPARIVVQWRGADGSIVRSFATARSGATKLNIPVNNFAGVSWDAVVPKAAKGLQAISIEGTAALLALDATRRDAGTPATAVANVPVTDPVTGQPEPASRVARSGASFDDGGPSPNQVAAMPGQESTAGFDRFRSALSEYEPVYFNVGTRGRTTARFQISAKYRLFTPTPNTDPSFLNNLYFGYTQTSLWDLQSESKPFLDTTFNPSAFWLNENIWTSPDQNWRFGGQVGAEHQSNGKGGVDSRSINDAFVTPRLSYLFDDGSTLTFAPKVKAYFKVAKENPNYSDYAGNVDWRLRYTHNTGAVLSAMYRQGDKQRRTTQLDMAWPLKRTWLDMNGYLHLQYFNGYGETLLGYNERGRSQFRIGLSLVP